jgi:colanic acid biosynthesis glycosyl transferase WcaI
VVSQYFWPENFRINDLVAELVNRGHAVTVLTGEPNYPEGKIFPDYRRSPKSYLTFSGATVVRVPMISRGTGAVRLVFNYLSFALSASFLGPWRLRGQAFDVIFVCQLSPVTVGIPAAILRKVKSAPMLFWVLDLWPETLQALRGGHSVLMLKGIGALVSWIYSQCDVILAQSRNFIPEIRSRCRAPCRIEYFPSWSDVELDAVGTSPAPEVPPRHDALTVMFTGNIGEAQDFPAILQAAELLKNERRVRWVIVGDGRMADWVRREVWRRGISESVLLTGRFPLERMPSFYLHADALLVSLKDEPLFAMTIPGKLQAYLAVGKPVLAMLNGEGADIVKTGGAGWACPAGDGQALARAVKELLDTSIADRAALGQRALELSKTAFDKTQIISRLEILMQELAVGSEVQSV